MILRGILVCFIRVRIYLILWALFISIPYFLSQQVYLWAVLSAAILASALKSLKLELRDELVKVKSYDERDYLPLEQLNCKVKMWQTLHMEMLHEVLQTGGAFLLLDSVLYLLL